MSKFEHEYLLRLPINIQRLWQSDNTDDILVAIELSKPYIPYRERDILLYELYRAKGIRFTNIWVGHMPD